MGKNKLNNRKWALNCQTKFSTSKGDKEKLPLSLNFHYSFKKQRFWVKFYNKRKT